MKASSSSSFSLSVLGDYKRSGGARFFRHRVITFGLRSHPSITKGVRRLRPVFARSGIVLGLPTGLINARVGYRGCARPLLWLSIPVCRYYEVFGELFLGESLSLRADSSGRPKLPGSDSRLNLAHLFAASSRST
ncbi:hypothetical protein Bca4012_100377 [Brassica carinata]|uniref:Uncharacterized protein n=1 Tax=Brassica carinata TaxID=52824 RepID=A0A8X7PL82_BRACI|nr:hypothetical protein Bca52824_082919 [Brassica carinata]